MTAHVYNLFRKHYANIMQNQMVSTFEALEWRERARYDTYVTFPRGRDRYCPYELLFIIQKITFFVITAMVSTVLSILEKLSLSITKYWVKI